MRKVINGKMYHTQTAKKLNCCGTMNLGMSDYNYWRETLYLKKTGEYFLHGEGHANSKYALSVGGGYIWGQKIIPYTESQAKEWAERELDGDEYVALFGEPEE